MRVCYYMRDKQNSMNNRKTAQAESTLLNPDQFPLSYYKGKRCFVALIVTAAVVVTVSLAFAYDYFNKNNVYSISYVCRGVDSQWLNDHPFDVSSFPTQLKRKESLVLEAPTIEGYKFVLWEIEWKGGSLSLSGTSTFKNNESYVASNHFNVSIFNSEALVTASYVKN